MSFKRLIYFVLLFCSNLSAMQEPLSLIETASSIANQLIMSQNHNAILEQLEVSEQSNLKDLIKEKLLEDYLSVLISFDPLSLTLTDHTETVNCAAISTCNNFVATGSDDHNVLIWTLRENPISCVAQLGHNDVVNTLAFNSNYETCQYLLTGCDDNKGYLWHLPSLAAENYRPYKLKFHRDLINSVAFSGNGKHVLLGSFDKTISFWDIEDILKRNRLPKTIIDYSSEVTSVALNFDGTLSMVGCNDNNAYLYNSNNKVQTALRHHKECINSVALSQNEEYALLGSNDNTASLWVLSEVDEQYEPIILRGHTNIVLSAVFSHDSNYILTGSADKTAKLWHIDHAQKRVYQCATILGHTDVVNAVAFSTCGNFAITASDDKTARLHRLNFSNLSLQHLIMAIKMCLTTFATKCFMDSLYQEEMVEVTFDCRDGSLKFNDVQQ